MNPFLFTADVNGVYRAPAVIAPLQAAAKAACLRWTVINLLRVRSKRALLAAFSRELDFPQTFGRNWDALADCLQDLSWMAEEGAVLLLRGAAEFAHAAPAEQAMLLEILDATAGCWRQRNRVFTVLLDSGNELPEFPVQ